MIKAFLDLSNTANTQVIITTHSTALVKELEFQHLRLVKSDSTTKTIENVLPNRLPYPSLNEVNFLAFSEITEEYHNELYGFIELEGETTNYRNGKATIPYNKLGRDGITIVARYRDWETDRKSTRLNSSHITRARMPSSA